MHEKDAKRIPRLIAYAPRAMGIVLLLAAATVVFGWWQGIPALKSLLPGLATMKANTALAFALLGALLFVVPPHQEGAPNARRTTTVLGAAAALGGFAALTLSQSLFGVELGIDQALFTDDGDIRHGAPGRMAAMTAINFMLLAAALALLDVRTRRGFFPGQWLLLAVAANAFLAVLGYLYGAEGLYRIVAFSSVALHTALLFLVTCLGIACLQPEAAFIRRLLSEEADGFVIRRLLPAALLVPPSMGWLRWQGELAGLYTTAYGLALFALSNVAVFSALAWWSARALQKVQASERALGETNAWQAAILNSADFTVISTDPQGTIRTLNAGAAALLGYAPVELEGKATPAVIHVAEEVAARARALSLELGRAIEPGFEVFVAKARLGQSDENEWTYVRKDGGHVPVRLSVTALRNAQGDITGFLGIGKDLTAERAGERARRESETRLRLITDNVPALIGYIDRDRVYRFNNATYAQWLDRPLVEITGHRVDEIYPPDAMKLLDPFISQALEGHATQFEFQSPDSQRYVHGSFIPDRDDNGQVRGFYSLVNDISVQKAAEAELWRLAQFDSLTGLANRRRYNERLAEAIARSERSGQPMALMFLDLDHFKSINDSLGHKGGDQVLQEFARRIEASVRRTDTAARLAGDEFVIILEALRSADEVELVAGKILDAMAIDFDIEGQRRRLSTSIGIAVREPGELDAEALLRRADTALYAAKAAGRRGFRVG